MRIFRVLAAIALALVPAVASAQSTSAPPATTGLVDFGVRGTTTSGEASRYERYRDLGDGLFLQRFRFDTERNGWFMNLAADQAGRRDERFAGTFARPGKFRGYASWDQIPMLMSRATRSLFEQSFSDPVGTITIPSAIRTQIQPTSAATPNVSLLPSLFSENAKQFDTESRRDILRAGFQYFATPELVVQSQFQSTSRNGTLPYGASFGHSQLVEFPAPIDHRLNDFDLTAEYARDPVLFRGGYTGSWFTNEFTDVTVDSPFRAFDATNASARAGLSLPTSNSYFSVNGLASVKLPRKSRATAFLSVGSLKDAGDAIMGQTVNTLNSPLAPERSTVNGEARTIATNLAFTSRPSRYVDVDLKYRRYDYDNRTPEFFITQRVAYDATPGNATMSTLGGISWVPTEGGKSGVFTEPFGLVRNTFDGDVRFLPVSGASVGVGYSRIDEERSHRFFENTADNVFRVTFDAVGNRYFSVRTKYEHGQRRGDVTEEAEEELFAIGEQPFTRHYDIASRDRNRVTVVGTVTPIDKLSLSASVAAGKDDYIESIFGLRDNTHRVYTVGADVVPSDLVSLGASYSYEKYTALSRSRQASPPSGAAVITFEQYMELSTSPNVGGRQILDASRNWATDGADRAHSFIVFAGVDKIRDKVDLNFSWDYNRSRALYTYMAGNVPDRTLPEEVIIDPSTLDTPKQLPLVKSEFNRGTVDVLYAVTERLGIGLSYWHERYRVSDFTLDAESTPNLARSNAVLIGYLYRPYTANTVWGRLVYHW